ncbi:uncharacterized protein LOC124205042 [Daphnia pulex]|uniref:uncharacterized protein LOC124205042 n=1 Tax=Daphnia pulex TaxID=6669 RepID=UPI001EDEE39D|nr:uncharacterized protein LOC124205042 [Daphnia pulex]
MQQPVGKETSSETNIRVDQQMARQFFIIGVLLVFACWTSASSAVSLEDQLQQLRNNFIKFKEETAAKEIKLEEKVAELETKLIRLEGLVERNLIDLIKEDLSTKIVHLESNVHKHKEMLVAIQSMQPNIFPKLDLDNLEVAQQYVKASGLRTCREIRSNDLSLPSGMYWIDPDGQGVGDDAIFVHCDMTTGTTSVLHDSESPMNVGHCVEPGCYSRAINYNATSKQMSALAELSTECHQSIAYDCNYAPFEFNNVPYAWWNDRNGNPHYYWSGNMSEGHGCQCSIDQNCVDANAKCNCDSISPMQLTDAGTISDKKLLPITRLNFGRTHFEISSGVHTLGRFQCSGQVTISGMPKSCEDLWRIGHSLNGVYSVVGSAMMESVYCDFTKLPEDPGFQKWIGYADVKSVPTYFYVQRSERFSKVNVSIPFNMALVNIGNAINLTTGIFTAPRAGSYFFAFSGLAEFPKFSGLLYIGVDLYLNGQLTGRTFIEDVNTVAGQYSPLSFQTTLKLKQGDEIWLQIDTVSPLIEPQIPRQLPSVVKSVLLFDDFRHFTHFTGWMLDEDVSLSL